MAWVPVNFQTVSQIAIEILNISCAKSFLGTKNFCRTTNWMGMLFMLREYMNGQGVSNSSGTTVPNITSSNPPPFFSPDVDLMNHKIHQYCLKYTPPFFFLMLILKVNIYHFIYILYNVSDFYQNLSNFSSTQYDLKYY